MKMRENIRQKKENKMNRRYSFSFSLLDSLTSLISPYIKILVLASFGGTLTISVSPPGCQAVL